MRISGTQKLTLSAMVVALTVLSLFAANVIPYVKIACLFLSSIFIYSLLCEAQYLFAILSFIASSLVAFLILPDKTYLMLYLGLFGHYAVFKVFADTKITNIIVCACVKLIYCNVFVALDYVIATQFFNIAIPLELNIPKWAVIIILEVALIIFDVVQSFVFAFYNQRIRNAILPQR